MNSARKFASQRLNNISVPNRNDADFKKKMFMFLQYFI